MNPFWLFVYIVLADIFLGIAKPFFRGFLRGVMSHKIYKSTGLRVMDTKEGDFMMNDPGWKSGVQMTFTMTDEMLEEARVDDKAAAQLGRNLRAFLIRHRQLRHDRDS